MSERNIRKRIVNLLGNGNIERNLKDILQEECQRTNNFQHGIENLIEPMNELLVLRKAIEVYEGIARIPEDYYDVYTLWSEGPNLDKTGTFALKSSCLAMENDSYYLKGFLRRKDFWKDLIALPFIDMDLGDLGESGLLKMGLTNRWYSSRLKLSNLPKTVCVDSHSPKFYWFMSYIPGYTNEVRTTLKAPKEYFKFFNRVNLEIPEEYMNFFRKIVTGEGEDFVALKDSFGFS